MRKSQLHFLLGWPVVKALYPIPMAAPYIKTVAEYPKVRTLSRKLLRDLSVLVAYYDEEIVELARTQNEELNGVYALALAGAKTKIEVRVIVSNGQVMEMARRPSR